MKQLLHLAKVINNNDPENRHRVEISLLNRPDDAGLTSWARVAQPYASDGAGVAFVPEVGDEVIVAFDRGVASEPIVLGCLYNGDNPPPSPASSSGDGRTHIIKTPTGHEIALHDGADGGVTLRTAEGSEIKLEDGTGSVRISGSAGGSVTMDGAGKITIEAASTIEVTAASTLKIKAAQVDVEAAHVKCSGVLQSDTLVTNSVVASSYTPGAGNIW